VVLAELGLSYGRLPIGSPEKERKGRGVPPAAAARRTGHRPPLPGGQGTVAAKAKANRI